MANQNQSIDRRSLRLLRAIYAKTGGRKRGVRDVAELETSLSKEEAHEAWRKLLDLGLIERFSQDYAARLSLAGVAFIESNAQSTGTPQKVLIVPGSDTLAHETVADFIEEIGFQAIVLQEPVVAQAEAHGDAQLAIVVLTPADLGNMNVIIQVGYFIGRLGRTNVFALVTGSDQELPKDLAGVALRRLDENQEWMATLRHDLQ